MTLKRSFTALILANFLLLAGSAAQAGDDDFMCLTLQYSERDQSKMTEFVPFTSPPAQGGTTTENFVFRPGASSTAIEYYQTALASDVWQKKHSLPGSSNKIFIGVYFLDGTEWQQNKVKEIVQAWQSPEIKDRIEFLYGNRELCETKPAAINADVLSAFCRRRHIRIMFNTNLNQSMIGTETLTVTDLSQPTMWLSDILPDKEPQNVRRTILHEFGHALGLRHEHQNPDAPFVWKKQSVLADVKAKLASWTMAMVEEWIIKPLGRNYACAGYKKFDPTSIMIYPIKESWLSSGKPVPLNDVLASGDVGCVSGLYKSGK